MSGHRNQRTSIGAPRAGRAARRPLTGSAGRHRSRLVAILAATGTFLASLVVMAAVPVSPAGATNAVTQVTTPGPACGATWTNYTVPAGFVSATVTLTGGGGGAGGTETANNHPGNGGGGAKVVTTITDLTAGGSVSLTVGCGGGGGRDSAAGGTGGTSGFGAGGSSNGTGNTGGGGGGATALCVGSGGCTTPKVVAAGGGGGGTMWRFATGSPLGGDGGNAGNGTANGSSGAAGTNGGANGGGGGGATGAAVGGAGSGSCAGAAGSGRNGGAGGGSSDSCSSGGGGGGGYFGGGGGGGANASFTEAGGGGGAGSSYSSTGSPTYTVDTTKSSACGQTGSPCTVRTNPGRGGVYVNDTHGNAGEAGAASIVWTVAATQASWNALGTGQPGVNFATQPQVTVRDYQNTLVPNEAITILQASGPTPNALSCTTNPATSNASGVATFAGCKVNGVAGTYTFNARTASTTPASILTGTGTITIVAPTSTTVVCSPSPFAWNGSSTCTVTVTDTSLYPSTPTGTITMGATGDDVTPSFSGCTLAQLSPGVGRCTSTFTADLQDRYSVSATFVATSTHTTSLGTVTVSMRSRLTSTAVVCSPNIVPWGSPTTCTATVTDVMSGTKSAPAGSVTFGQSGGGTFDFPTCELESISSEASACTADFTPTSAGNKTVNASYAGSTSGSAAGGFIHASSSSAQVPVVATGAGTPTRHSTSSTASCTPNPVPAGSPTTCTVTVTDTFAFGPTATPVGMATWGYSGGGAFSPSNTCALVELTPGVSASCSVTFTPTAPAGNRTVNATYGGTSSFFGSGTGSVLVVATAPVTPQPSPRRDTTTSLSCQPSTQVGVGAGCLVTVTDVNPSPGPRSEPTGTVTFGFSGGGSLDPVTCTLVSNGDGQSSSCGTSYTPTSVGNKTVIASFTGTALHKPSGSGSVFIVATS